MSATCDRILIALGNSDEPLSTKEVERRCGLWPYEALRYLGYLKGQGKIRVAGKVPGEINKKARMNLWALT